MIADKGVIFNGSADELIAIIRHREKRIAELETQLDKVHTDKSLLLEFAETCSTAKAIKETLDSDPHIRAIWLWHYAARVLTKIGATDG